MNRKTKKDIIEHVSMSDERLLMFSVNYIIETSIFYQHHEQVTAIIAGNEYRFTWVKNDELNLSDDFRYVSFGKNKTLVEYY